MAALISLPQPSRATMWPELATGTPRQAMKPVRSNRYFNALGTVVLLGLAFADVGCPGAPPFKGRLAPKSELIQPFSNSEKKIEKAVAGWK